MRLVFFMAALLLVAGSLAFAESNASNSLPSASASGKSLGAEKYVPALEARAEYVACRVDYQAAVLEGMYGFSPSQELLDAVGSLEGLKSGLLSSASDGNLAPFNAYVRGEIEPAMRSAANLSRQARREVMAGNASNLSNASGMAAMYREAKRVRIECEQGAREHAKNLSKMALRERVEAAKQKLEQMKERVRERLEAMGERLEAVKERVRERLNATVVSGANNAGNGNGSGIGSSQGREGGNPSGNGNGNN